jgi:hypothetical protein
VGEKGGIGTMTLSLAIIVILAIGAVAYLGYGSLDSKGDFFVNLISHVRIIKFISCIYRVHNDNGIDLC